MGGLLILLSLVVSTLLWARLDNMYVWIVLGVTISFGLLGFIDDYLKVTQQNPKGVVGKGKLVFQFIVAMIAGYFCMKVLGGNTRGARWD